LEDKLKFAEKMHKKHHEEVSEYEKYADNLDRGKFNTKVKRITFELHSEKRDYTKSLDSMEVKKEELRIYLERAKRDLQDEMERN
jgi:hypothetical protein